jgi:hypothetical protein
MLEKVCLPPISSLPYSNTLLQRLLLFHHSFSSSHITFLFIINFKLGADIVISYLNEHKDAEETKRVVEEAQKKCELIPGDIQDDNHCKEIIKRAVDKFGKIGIKIKKKHGAR